MNGDINNSFPSSFSFFLSLGNYLLLNEEPWIAMSKLFDELWFIECDLDGKKNNPYRPLRIHNTPPNATNATTTITIPFSGYGASQTEAYGSVW